MLLIVSIRGLVVASSLCSFTHFRGAIKGLVYTTQRSNARIVCIHRSSNRKRRLAGNGTNFRVCSNFGPRPNRGVFAGAIGDYFGRDNLLRCLQRGRMGRITVTKLVASCYVSTAIGYNFRRNFSVVIPGRTGAAASGRCVANGRACRCCGKFV